MVSSQRGRFSRLPRWQKLSIACSGYITRMVLTWRGRDKIQQIFEVHNITTAELRATTSLEFPPKTYIQNANKCTNKILKQGKSTIRLSFKSVVELLGSAAIKMQEKQVKSKITSRNISIEFQRKELINNFNTSKMKGNTPCNFELTLLIKSEESHILYPPFAILKECWMSLNTH